MKRLLNKLFERLGYVPKEELDHIQHKFILLLKETQDYGRIIQCIGLAIKHNYFNKEYLKQ